MLVAGDRIKETTASTGAVVTLGGAATNYLRFSSICAVGDYVRITRVHQTLAEWETGLYQYTAANELTRVAFENGQLGFINTFSAGTQDVFCEHTSTLALVPMIPNTLNRTVVLADASVTQPGVQDLAANGILDLLGTSIVEFT